MLSVGGLRSGEMSPIGLTVTTLCSQGDLMGGDVIDSLWYGVTLGGWRIAGLTVPTLIARLPLTTKTS